MMLEKRALCWSGVGKLVGRRRGTDVTGKLDKQLPGVAAQAAQLTVPLDARLDRLLELLPEGAGDGKKLRDFWAIFSALDLRPLLNRRKWNLADFEVLEKVRMRCIHATFPFAIALQLLLHEWERGNRAPGYQGREAAAAARTSEQWNTLLAVQNVLGRLDAPSPSYKELKRIIPERRERYMTQARAFLLVAAILDRVGNTHSRLRHGTGDCTHLEEACIEGVTAFLAVQHVVRSGKDSFGEGVPRET